MYREYSQYDVRVYVCSVLTFHYFSCRDLLGSDPNQRLEVKMNPEGGVHVPGLVSYEVGCVQDVNQVGNRMLCVSASNSVRSFYIRIS